MAKKKVKDPDRAHKPEGPSLLRRGWDAFTKEAKSISNYCNGFTLFDRWHNSKINELHSKSLINNPYQLQLALDFVRMVKYSAISEEKIGSSLTLDKVIKARPKTLAELAAVRAPNAKEAPEGIETLFNTINTNITDASISSDKKTAATAVSSAINEVLEPTPELQAANDEFKTDIAALKIAFRDGKYHPTNVAEELQGVILRNARTKLNEYYDQQKTKLNDQFANSDFKANLRMGLNLEALDPPALDMALATHKKTLESAMDAARAASLKKLEDDTKQAILDFHAAGALHAENAKRWASMYAHNPNERAQLRKRRKENIDKGIRASVGGADKDIRNKFFDFDPSKEGVILTLTGNKLTKVKVGEYEMKIPGSWRNPRLHSDPSDRVYDDFKELARQVADDGFACITIDLQDSGKDEEEYARLAYEAAVSEFGEGDYEDPVTKEKRPRVIIRGQNGGTYTKDRLFGGEKNRPMRQSVLEEFAKSQADSERSNEELAKASKEDLGERLRKIKADATSGAIQTVLEKDERDAASSAATPSAP